MGNKSLKKDMSATTEFKLKRQKKKKLAGWLDDFWRDIALALKALTPEETEAFATGFEKILDSFESRIL